MAAACCSESITYSGAQGDSILSFAKTLFCWDFQQLAALKRRQPRSRLTVFDKTFWILAHRFWAGWKQAVRKRWSAGTELDSVATGV